MRSDKPVIGIVGGIGSGKSLVAEEFARQGCLLIAADRLNEEILRTPEVVATLRGWWGDDIVLPDGSASRRKIAQIVFADLNERRRLESLTHPLIAARRAAIIAANIGKPEFRAIILDSPLLFEAGLDSQCDRIVFIEASRAHRAGRVRQSRGWDETEWERRERSQLALEEKKARSDYVIVNDGPPDAIRKSVAEVLQAVLYDVGDRR